MRMFPAAVAIAALFAVNAAQAATYNPIGVQNDISYAEVINGGWSVVYRGDYSANGVSIDSIFGGIAAGSKVMLAAIQDGSSNFDVLAAAAKEDVLTYTAWNTTHLANNVNWYFNGGSMGFAGAGDTIYQTSADVVGAGSFGRDPNGIERDRLSWHTSGTSGYNGVATSLNGGWRSGSNVWLNSSTAWDRVVLVQTNVAAPVPEPETYAMMMAGLGLLGGMARRKKQATK